MLLIKDVAKKIQDDLNDIASQLNYGDDIVFNITDNIQRYESDMKNADDVSYTPACLKISSAPFIFNTLDIEIKSYDLLIYGWSKQRHQVEEIFKTYNKLNNTGTTIGDIKVFLYVSDLFIDDFLMSQDGYNKNRFDARVDIELNLVPTAFDGNSVTIELDDTPIPFNMIRYRKDKSIITNVPYGNNNRDVKMVSDTLELQIPIIDGNAKVDELLADVLDSTYNKKMKLSWEIGNLNKTMDVILRVGTISLVKNSSPLTFWVTLEVALPRKLLTIDTIAFPVLRTGFTGEKTPSTYPRIIDGNYVMKSRPLRYGRSLDAVIVLPNYEEQELTYTMDGDNNTGTATPTTNTSFISGLMPMTVIDGFEAFMTVNDGAPIKVNLSKSPTIIRVWDNNIYDFSFSLFTSSVSSNNGLSKPTGSVKFFVPKNKEIIKAQELIDEIKSGKTSKTFKIKETKLGKDYENIMYLIHGNYEDAENPDMFVTCTFIDADITVVT